MRVHYDPLDGFFESEPYTHEVPDAEWRAYRKLVDAANSLEDRFVATYGIAVDEYATVRGILTDEQIETLRGLGIGMDDKPTSGYSVTDAREVAPPAPPAISAEEAARQIIARNAHKCQHRNQVGPFDDGTVRCRDCGGIIYGGTGVKKVNDPDDPKHFHNPGTVDPRRFEGTV